MKHLKLFEDFESDEEFGDRKTKSGSFINPEGDEYFEDEDEYDPYSYKGCGCCPVCTGERDCECGCPECNCPDDDDYDYIEYDNSEILESLITEKNVAKNSKLWNACKAWAKSKYDVWPSAYACGAAAKRYKSKGGKWKKKKKK
jgi:hypothetical protein